MTTLVATAAGGTRNWTDSATWLPAQVPTAADDCQLSALSGPVTINSGAVARSLDCTGYVGTLTHANAVDFRLGDATAGAGNVALKLVAGMTYTLPGSGSTSLISTSATQQTITTGGKLLINPNVAGLGSSYILSDGLTLGAAGTMTLSAGTLNTNNLAHSWGLFVISGASAKTLTLGSSAIAITGNSNGAVSYTGSNLTITANTAVMTMTGATTGGFGAFNYNGLSVVFTSAVTTAAWITTGAVLKDVTFNGPVNKTGTMRFGTVTITGTLTINGNSTTNRLLVFPEVSFSARTITAAAVSLTNVDFQDITAAGAAAPFTGTSMGNALGNTNITFDPSVTQTRNGAGGNYSDLARWTSRVPLPQDNVVIDSGSSGAIGMDMPRVGADVNFTGFAGTISWSSLGNTVYGSLTIGAGVASMTGTGVLTLSARSAKTITSNGKAFTQGVTVNAPGGTYTLVDSFSTVSPLIVSAGTFISAGFSITALTVFFGGGTTVTLSTSVVTTTATTTTSVVTVSVTCTISAASATFVIGTASANARSFQGGVDTFGTLTYTVAGSTGSLTITDSSTFNTINFSDPANARSLLFTAGTTTTVTNWNVRGTAGKLMTVDSVTAATHTLSKASGVASSDYLSVKNSLAGGGAAWYAGANSTDQGGNTGWQFVAAPAGARWVQQAGPAPRAMQKLAA